MNPAQSSPIPAPGEKPAPRDWLWLARFTSRGLLELIRARIVFSRLQAREIPARNRAAKSAADPEPSIPPDVLSRISYVLPRLSDRLPWRSDCMVQAIAAQNWLSAYGAAGEIQIGVENPKDGGFGAHAWLLYDAQVITGGDIERYEVILSESRFEPDSGNKSQQERSD